MDRRSCMKTVELLVSSLPPHMRRQPGADRCRVSISTCSATRSAWKTCSRSFDSNPRAGREANCMVPVPSTVQRPPAAERSRSTLPTDGAIATSATVAATNSNSGRRFTSSRCTTPPSIYVMPSAVNSPGFTAGKAPPQSEQKRRGTGTLNHQETLPFPTTLSISTVRQTGAISGHLPGLMVALQPQV